jgi:Mlc titration factor MtfA (ptsG expression regulator)
MDTYGATNPAEFFAVATETFFEEPHHCTIDVLSYMTSFAIIINWTHEIGTEKALLKPPTLSLNKSNGGR